MKNENPINETSEPVSADNKAIPSEGATRTKATVYSALGVGGVAVGSHIGPGFASGVVSLVYLVANGWFGAFLGPLITYGLSGVWHYINFECCRVFHVSDYKGVTEVAFGKKFAPIMVILRDIVMITLTFSSFATLFSVGATLINNWLGVNQMVSITAMILVCVILVTYGEELVRSSNFYMMFAMFILVAYVIATNFPIAWPIARDNIIIPRVNFRPIWGFSGIVWFMLLEQNLASSGMAGPISSTLGALGSRFHSFLASGIFSIPMILINMGVCVMMLALWPDISGNNIPIFYAMQNLAGNTAGLAIYTILCLLAIISTGVGWSQMMISRIKNTNYGTRLYEKHNYKMLNFIIAAVILILPAPLSAMGAYKITSTIGAMISAPSLLIYVFPVPIALIFRLRKKYKELRAAGQNIDNIVC